jgi:hypothetical protein
MMAPCGSQSRPASWRVGPRRTSLMCRQMPLWPVALTGRTRCARAGTHAAAVARARRRAARRARHRAWCAWHACEDGRDGWRVQERAEDLPLGVTQIRAEGAVRSYPSARFQRFSRHPLVKSVNPRPVGGPVSDKKRATQLPTQPSEKSIGITSPVARIAPNGIVPVLPLLSRRPRRRYQPE